MGKSERFWILNLLKLLASLIPIIIARFFKDEDDDAKK